jgi:hypothetical protein
MLETLTEEEQGEKSENNQAEKVLRRSERQRKVPDWFRF